MEDVFVFKFDGALIELYGPEMKTVVNGKTVFYKEGTWCEYDEDADEYQADFCLTWFYEDSEHPENYLYFESDTPEVALYNFTNAFEAPRYVCNVEMLKSLPASQRKLIADMIVKDHVNKLELMNLLINSKLIIESKDSTAVMSDEVLATYQRFLSA